MLSPYFYLFFYKKGMKKNMLDLSIYNIANENWDPVKEGFIKNIRNAYRENKEEKKLLGTLRSYHRKEWEKENLARKNAIEAFQAYSDEVVNKYFGGYENEELSNLFPVYDYIHNPFNRHPEDSNDGSKFRWYVRFNYKTSFEVSMNDYRSIITEFRNSPKKCPLVETVEISPIKHTNGTRDDDYRIRYTSIELFVAFKATDEWINLVTTMYGVK